MGYIESVLVPNIIDIFTAPLQYPDMIWITIPLIAVFIMMEFYQAIYKGEELGWENAVTNSLALFFVFLDMIRFIYQKYGWDFMYHENLVVTLPLIIFIGFMGLFLLVLTFFRDIPKKFAIFWASPLTVNYIAYFVIYSVYSEKMITLHVFLAAFIIYLALIILFSIFRFIFPKVKLAENLPRFTG